MHGEKVSSHHVLKRYASHAMLLALVLLTKSQTFTFKQQICVAVSLCYSNALHGGFCFDDHFAAERNPDVHPDAPYTDLLKHDFWGQGFNYVLQNY